VLVELPANSQAGTYKLKVYNREIKLANNIANIKRYIDVSLSMVECIYAFFNGFSFTLSTTNAKMYPLKLQLMEVYGFSIETFELQKKVSALITALKVDTG